MPAETTCQGFFKSIAAQLPYKSKKIEITELIRDVVIIQHNQHVLVRKCPKGENYAGLVRISLL